MWLLSFILEMEKSKYQIFPKLFFCSRPGCLAHKFFLQLPFNKYKSLFTGRFEKNVIFVPKKWVIGHPSITLNDSLQRLLQLQRHISTMSKAQHNFKEILILPKSSGVTKDSHLRDHYVLFMSNWSWLIDTWCIIGHDFGRAKRSWPVIFWGGQIDHNDFNLLSIMTNYAGHH